MKVKKSTIKYEDLPDTITPEIYSDWRGVGIVKARNKFLEYGFPLIKDCGVNLIADKRAVLLHEISADNNLKKELLEKIAIKMFG